MKSLSDKVALVTGGSRGVGKGIALGLGGAGATVYATGRTTQEGTDIEKLGGTVYSTAEEVTAIGGKVIAALANDPNLMSRTGKVWVGAALAQEYGIEDIDEKQPRPVTLEEA